MDYLVYGVLALSLAANLILGLLSFKKNQVLTTDAKKLLAEIMSGSAVVRIQVLDPTSLMYRSPKG